MGNSMDNKKAFANGLRDSVPIGLGYMAVAFSLGMMAKKIGFTPLQGYISSFLNHASAGEYAEFSVVKAAASYLEMVIIILITNARYILMSIAYSQRFSSKTGTFERIIMSFGITDEIFGATIAQVGDLVPAYTYGLMCFSIPCWATGTALGIAIGNVLPASVVGALSISLYGMFLAIIIPPAKKDKIVALFIVISFAASYLASKLPYVKNLSESTRVIILTICITSIAAALFPHANATDPEAANAN